MEFYVICKQKTLPWLNFIYLYVLILLLRIVLCKFTVYQHWGWDGHDTTESGHDCCLLLHQLHHNRSVTCLCNTVIIKLGIFTAYYTTISTLISIVKCLSLLRYFLNMWNTGNTDWCLKRKELNTLLCLLI